MSKELKIISIAAVLVAIITSAVLLLGREDTEEFVYSAVPIKLGVFIETANAKYRLDEKLPSFEFVTRDGKGRLFAALIGARQVEPRKIEKNKVIYENVFPGVDIIYESFEDRLKENIILKSISAPTSFVYDLSQTFQGVDEFDLLSTNNILLTLYNKKTGEELIMLEMPKAFDASGRFLAYRYRLQKKEGKTLLILEPHKQYDFSQFKYPVTVDPPISVRQCDELLVKVGENGKGPALPKDGDIAAIRPCGWPWGKMERRDFVIVRVKKLTEEQRKEFTRRAEEDGKMGAIVYAVDYTKLASGGQLKKIRSYNKENPILDATSLPLSEVIQKKPDVLGSIIPSERRLANRIDTQFSTLRRLANRLITPVRAQTVNTFTIGTNARDYSTIQAWEDARGGDLVTANTVEKGEVYNDSVFTAGVLIDGSITDATHYMWLTVAPTDRHNGTAGTGARIDADALAATAIIDVADPYTIVEWLEIYDSTPTATQSTYGIRAQAGFGTYRNLIIHDIGSGAGGTDNSAGWTGWTTIGAAEVSNIYNNLIYNISGQGIQLVMSAGVFNNTLYNNAAYGIMCYQGYCGNSGVAVNITNNISVGNNTGTGGAADFETADLDADDYMNNNLSSDGTADDCSTCGQSLDNVVSQLADDQFVSTSTPNLHLKAGSAAINAGTSTPSVTFANDIDGDSRPVDTNWDIGADESPYYTEILRPNGAGAVAGGTPFGCTNNWECVDETPSDDDTTYVYNTSITATNDLYALADSANSGTIYGVKAHMNCRGLGALDGGNTLIRSGGLSYSGTSVIFASVYTEYTTFYDNNPGTNAAWTWTEVNALEAGMQMSANSTEARCTQVWATVYYIPSSNSTPSITSVSDSPDPVAAGDDIYFAVDWSDADAGEMIKTLICKTNSLTGTSCTDGAWCTSSVYTNRDPETCLYTTQVADIGTQNYYAFVCDDGGACSASTAGTFTVEERNPSAPSDLLVENMPNPVNISTTTPRFSAVFNDPNIGDLANKYCIQVNTAADFSGTDMWVADSNSCNTGVTMATTTQGTRSPDIYYNGTALSLNNTTYYWRIWFWDDSGNKSATSTTANFTMANQGTGVRLQGGRLKGGVRLK